ncbi:DnaA regulatory inactivator Hda [Betaproteobacteria bacterium]|nr:DnaA regulatory inactivator Hda [Betaproteobacteria bacterium]GHU43284.1 DnaA regulatory inactivator Hda [Betaproteobacteria bacterium]
MRQLLLDLLPETPPSLDNFVSGANGEMLTALSTWLLANDAPRTSGFLLWGEAGSGKSHLLKASGLPYFDARLDPALTALEDALEDKETENLAVDHVEALNPAGQIVLFNRFNHIHARRGRLLCAADAAPAHLALREDLRTRLGYGLIYRLLPLSDAEKSAALSEQAQKRAMRFPREARDYLLARASRDMRTLSALVAALDRYSLEQKRPITLPLLREVLAGATLEGEY